MKRPQVLGEHYAGLYLLKYNPQSSQGVSGNNYLQEDFSTFQKPVCNVKKSIEDSSLWHARLGHLSFTKLQELGLLSNLVSDDVIKQRGSSIVLLAVYVDDIIITGNNLAEITALKPFLDDKFKSTTWEN